MSDTEDVIEHLEQAYDAAPKDGVCPAEDCDDCLRCTIMELIIHLEDPRFMPHLGGTSE